MLTYILITFPINAYHSNVFSENSLIGVSLEIILQPPYLCSLHTCSPKAQPPKGIPYLVSIPIIHKEPRPILVVQ